MGQSGIIACMEEALIKLGLSNKEAKLYLLLLEHPERTAAQVAEAMQEKRTNVYALLESLQEKGLIGVDGAHKIKRFNATDPSVLNEYLQKEQERHMQAAASLRAAMPRLRSVHSLATNKPGVVHMAGMQGVQTLLEDMVRSTSEVLLVASNDVPSDTSDLELFRELLMQRKAAGVRTRALFHKGPHETRIREAFASRGFETRFMGDQPYKGEVVLYEDNTVFTVYDPSLMVTVVTNQYITDTMRAMFEELWQVAEV